jgi:hypothetical protein
MKIELKGRKFDTVEEIEVESQRAPTILTKKHFQDAFQKCKKHWDRRVLSQGDYF